MSRRGGGDALRVVLRAPLLAPLSLASLAPNRILVEGACIGYSP